MKRDILILITVLCVIVYVMLFTDINDNRVHVYDCSLAEISPDYPLEVKEECRNLRKQEYQKQRELEGKAIFI